ncbi:MAG TPA: hypothetical protein VF920_01240 [Dongiaceae bacterium]
MFGLPTIPKFLVLVLVVALVWFWSRRTALQQRSNQGGGQQGGQRPADGKNAGQAKAANAKQKSIEDLVKCPSCGTYIAAGSICDCGKSHR